MIKAFLTPLIRRLHSFLQQRNQRHWQIPAVVAVPAVPLVTTVGAIRM
jgi:hypothetical protein